MNRQEILEFINGIIKEEHGTPLMEEQLLTDSNIDSFGYAIFWLEIHEHYKLNGIDKLDEKMDYKTLTVGNIINYILTGDLKNVISKDLPVKEDTNEN